jgi:uncharacterized damage-inducible protein DinB
MAMNSSRHIGENALVTVPRPERSDYEDGFAAYVSRVADVTDAVASLTAQDETVSRVLSPLGDADAGYRYVPGKWSVKELLGHVCDAERIFAYRLLRIARGDATPLAGFDENTYVPAAQADQRTLADLLDEWHAVRAATIALVHGLPADAWTRRGTSNGHSITAPALLYIILGHVDHHLGVLQARYGISA